MVTPSTMFTTGHLRNSTLATAPSSVISFQSEKGGGAGTRSSGETGCSSLTGSEWPRGGSLTTSLIRMATMTPGTPTIMKAMRQEKFKASQPPATAPIMVPSGMPNE